MFSTTVQIREQSQEKRRDLFESLMRSTTRQAYHLAYRLTGNTVEAEDLVQETYLRAFRFFHRYDDSLPFTSWLYRIMTNAHIDHVRRRSKVQVTSLDRPNPDSAGPWEFPDESQAPDRHVEENGMTDQMELALKSISPEFRSAVLLADVEGMAYEEIAESMQISIGTVRSRIHRGRKQLRKYLEKVYPNLIREVVE